jgi:hypothetical protein
LELFDALFKTFWKPSSNDKQRRIFENGANGFSKISPLILTNYSREGKEFLPP